MDSQIRQCQNCKADFAIESEDLGFYQKIQVPPPTFCPSCRMARRMTWRNERSLYRWAAGETGENVIAMFPEGTDYKIYSQKQWWGDDWDALSYGRDYDFSRPFFEQFSELLKEVPSLPLFNTNPANSDYCNFASNNKDCYLFSGGGWNEKLLYGNRSMYSKESMDVYILEKSEFCYETLYCQGCYKLLFSKDCEGCTESAFLYNCRNCSNCFGCSNLRGKSYYIFNQPYSKEEYFEKLKEFNLGSYKALSELKKRFHEDIYLTSIHKFADLINCVNVEGDHVRNAKNSSWCFDIGGDKTENCKFINWGGFVEKDSYDTGPGAGWGGELLYETIDTLDVSRLISCITVHYSNNVSYSINCHSSSDLFGCYGLRSKKYCILNRQYSKEEYEALTPKIIEHMSQMPYKDKAGTAYAYGEFFPIELSPFAYNETVAQEYFPIDKATAEQKGYTWKEWSAKGHAITKKSEDLPDDIADVSDSILDDVIACQHEGSCNEQCTGAFRIVPRELAFYKAMRLALPRLCPNCRHYQRLTLRNPLKLWDRGCECAGKRSLRGQYANTGSHFHGEESCPNTFASSYSPDRQEIVYCEQCYQGEVA